MDSAGVAIADARVERTEVSKAVIKFGLLLRAEKSTPAIVIDPDTSVVACPGVGSGVGAGVDGGAQAY
jgi:hypothetical protein